MQNDTAGAAAPTRRQQEKQQRRRDLLDAAGRRFGVHGFSEVSLDDVGSDVGVTGQAIYRHFRGKQDLLGQLLLEVSEGLLDGAKSIRASEPTVAHRVEKLVAFQVDFALRNPEVIRVQDQQMNQLSEADRRSVRRMQREYMDIWATSIAALHPNDSRDELRIRVHGVVGLINSTSHSMKHFYGYAPSAETVLSHHKALTAMAHAAIASDVQSSDSSTPAPHA